VGLEPQEIIVADVGSTDRTAEIIASEFPKVRLLRCNDIQSFASARNAGLAQSSGPFVLFLDGDWLADPVSVDRLLSELQRNPALAIAVPRFTDDSANNHVGHNVRRFPTAQSLAAEFLMLHKLTGSEAVRKHRMLDFDHLTDRDIDHPCGPFLLARRKPLVESRGYDETFEGAWMEDVDLARRLHHLGWRCRFCASAKAVHMGRETIRHFFIERHYDAYYRSVLRYVGRYLPDYYSLVRGCLLIGLASKAAFSYALPASLRVRVLQRLVLYNSDAAIQGYRQMYVKAIQVAREMSNPC
jgi:hypothetical protein